MHSFVFIIFIISHIPFIQFSSLPPWSTAGSRPGGLISSAWATLVATGADGYRANAAIIARHFNLLRAELTQTPGIQIVGQPDCGMIAFTTCATGSGAGEAAVDIFAVADALAEIGAWEIGRLQNPKALQFPIGLRQNETVVRAFVGDLRAALEAVRADPKRFSKGMAAIYGGAVAMPNRGTVRELLLNYVDALYRAE